MSERPNPIEVYPGHCLWCGSAFEREHIDYADPESVGPSWDHYYGQYECGVMIDDVQVLYHDGPGKPDLRTLKVWDDRVQKPGQTKACSTIMELRWKTDPVALEADRTDTRTIRDIAPEAVAKYEHEQAVKRQLELMRSWSARLHQTEEWTDSAGKVWAITEMEYSHRLNLMGWLRERAAWFARREFELFYTYPVPTSDGASLAWEREESALFDMLDDPMAWMKETPLYRTLRESVFADAPYGRRAPA